MRPGEVLISGVPFRPSLRETGKMGGDTVHRPWEGTLGLRPGGAGLAQGRGPDFQCTGEAQKGSKLDQPDPVRIQSGHGAACRNGATWGWLDSWVPGTLRPL